MVSERTASGEGATAPVQSMREDLFRGIALAEAGELVCTGGASQRDRPLATWRDVFAADGRTVTFLVRKAGTLFVVEAAGWRA